MKKLSKKGILLFAVAMALCAFAMPSIAGAVSWTVVGSEHTLDSPNVGYTATSPFGAVTSLCTASSLTATVAGSANLEITAATFGGNCTLHGPGFGTCTMTQTAQALPWTGTAISATDVQIHGIRITLVLDHASGSTCSIPGASYTITGTVTGVWNNTERELLFNGAGLTAHATGGGAVTLALATFGTFRDTQQTLVVDDICG